MSKNTQIAAYANSIYTLSNGNVGIGVNNPSDILDVQKNQNATTNFYFRNTNVTDTNSRAYFNLVSGNVVFTAKAINNDHCYLEATNDMFFQTGGGTRVVIKSSGNVGIGLTNPSFPLEVSSTSTTLLARFTSNQANAAIRIVNNSSNSGRTYSIGSGDTTSAAGNNFYIYDETNGALRFAINNNGSVGIGTSSPYDFGLSSMRTLHVEGSTYGTVIAKSGTVGCFLIADSGASGAAVGTYTNHEFKFTTNNVQRAIITTNGFFKASNNNSYYGLYDTVYEMNSSASTSWTLVLRNMSTDPYGLRILYSGASPNGGSNYFIYAQDNTTARYTVSSNGSASSSDERLKKNIETARDGYLEDLCKLRVVKYNWFNSEDNDDKLLGLIAQEVEQVFPKLIKEEESTDKTTTYKMIKDSVLPYMLLKALQEQQTQIEELKSLINK